MTQIVSTEKLTDSITAIEIEAPEIAAAAKPGQIVMIRLEGETETRPRPIADIDAEKGTITIVIRKMAADAETEAEEQTALASAVTAEAGADAGAHDSGDCAKNATTELGEDSGIHIDGPLGRFSNTLAPSKALLVAEGLGIPAVFTRLRDLKESGCYTTLIAGYPSKSELFWLDRLDKICDELYVITDDGSFGIKGPVRQTLKAVCDQVQEIEHVFAAGPFKLLKSTADTTRPLGIPTSLSLAAVLDRPDGEPAPTGFSDATTANIDWSDSINLDGHKVDFDELKKKLGFQIKK